MLLTALQWQRQGVGFPTKLLLVCECVQTWGKNHKNLKNKFTQNRKSVSYWENSYSISLERTLQPSHTQLFLVTWEADSCSSL